MFSPKPFTCCSCVVSFLLIAILSLPFSPLFAANSQATRSGEDVIVRLQTGSLKLRFCTAKIVHIVYDPSGTFPAAKSLVVQRDWKPVAFTTGETAQNIELRTTGMKVKIAKGSGAVRVLDPSDNLLYAEDPLNPHVMTAAVVLDETTHHGQLNLKLADREGIYGMGQYQDGVMNYRGHDLRLVQENTQVAMPFLISTNGYGLLLDNYSKILFHDGPDSTSLWCEVADQLEYYIMVGDDMDDVIRSYREATGQAPMLGKWAYGYWQSKERYKTQQEVLGIAREYRDRKIPVDNIMQDWNYWGDDNAFYNAMRFDSSRYPDPKGMIDSLHNVYNLHLMISIWPVAGSQTPMYREMDEKKLLWSPFHWTDGHTYDAYSPEARSIYWRYVNNGLFSLGVDAFWMDATEPECYLAPTERSTKMQKRIALGSVARYLNTYSLMTTSGVYEGQRSVDSNKRVCILTRSAFPGQQCYSAATWSGDITPDWVTFRNQISAGVNFCMSGIPYWSNDIGGFQGKRYSVFTGVTDPAYQELYVRWFQFASFNPIFRAHGTDFPREIWQFGKPGSWAYDALVKYDSLRYRLMPYIYSLAWNVTSNGSTMMRGLPMDFAADTAVYNINDQFMFGSAFLVSPVTEQMYYGRSLYYDRIAPDRYFTENGKQGGLTARFYNGSDFDTLVTEETWPEPWIDMYLGHEYPQQLNWEKYSIRWVGELKTKEAGEYEFWLASDDGVRFWLNDSLLFDLWNRPIDTTAERTDRTDRIKVTLDGERQYKFRLEFQQRHIANHNATLCWLGWRTPNTPYRKFTTSRPGGRALYLPRTKGGWYDFWNGSREHSGRKMNRKVPIDIMPLYVRAGSIVPMGPVIQYASERPADPIELRVYTGADGAFTLYEDEGDNYNYEKGVCATIPMQWNQEKQTLTLGKRNGVFPGMLRSRTFNIVWVDAAHGTGIDAVRRPDKTVRYDGQEIHVTRTKK